MTSENEAFLMADENNSSCKTVFVRIEFLNFGEIDTMNEKFYAEVRIRSRWTHSGEKIDKFDKDKHWHPKLFIQNALSDKYQEEKNYVVKQMDDDQIIVTEVRSVKGYFWERLELNNFPLDVQALHVTVASKLKPKHVKIVADLKPCSIHSEAKNTFRDQQKFNLYRFGSKLIFLVKN